MMSKKEKEDILRNVNVELATMFDVLTNHYNRPQYIAGLPELEKIETYLKAKLVEYDPACLKLFSDYAEDLTLESISIVI